MVKPFICKTIYEIKNLLAKFSASLNLKFNYFIFLFKANFVK